jgi:hypothetical protein
MRRASKRKKNGN